MGLGEVMEKNSPRPPDNEDSAHVSHTKVRKVLDTLRGQTVIARNSGDGIYYPGTVVKCTDSRHALVKFSEIGQKTVPTRFVIPTGGAVARPVLRVGDYVLLRVMNFETKYDCYVPGIVRNTPQREAEQIKFYTVMIYSGQKASALRNHLVKISKSRFTFAVRYLKDVQMEESSNIEVTPHHSESEGEDYTARRNADREVAQITNGIVNGETPAPAIETPIHTKAEYLQTQEKRLDELQHQLEITQREQSRQQRILRKETKRLGRAQEKMAKEQSKLQRQTEERMLEEQKKMMQKQDELIVKYEQTKSLIESSVRTNTITDYDDKINAWITSHPGDTSSMLSPGRTTESDSPRKDQKLSRWDPRSSSSFLQKHRAKLAVLRIGEEVLSRWSDEGWYYRGTVRQIDESSAYFIEDSCGDIEKIWREDIITDEDDAENIIQVKDAVVALHPSYAFSYCPGVIMKVFPDLWLLVRFYDGQEARLPREEVYRVHPEKFEYDVAYVLQREDQWVGQAVVARDDSTGLYHLASVTERVGNGRQYVITWSDGSMVVQSSSAIFGAFTKRRPLAIGDRVLAIADPVRLVYLPGTIRDVVHKSLVVKFCDESRQKNIDATQVFWLSQDYYEHAVAYYYSKGGRQKSRDSSLSGLRSLTTD